MTLKAIGSRVAGMVFATTWLIVSPTLALAGGVKAHVTAPEPTWRGQQYGGADDKGHAYILRPQEFLVYPLEDGELGKPVALEHSPVRTPLPVLDAAIDGPRDWVALFGGEVRWIRAGKEEILPELHWSVAAVTLLDGRPVVAVYPSPIGRVSERELRIVPRLLTPNRNTWSILVESNREGFAGPAERAAARITDAARLLTDSRGTLWLAGTYRYHLANYSAAGDERLILEVDGAEVRHRDEAELEGTRVAFEKERARHADPSKVQIAVNTAVPAILDLAEGRDGKIYLVVSGASGGGGSWALDRFDPVTGLLERTLLDTFNSGALSIAAAKDGLYIVPFNGLTRRLTIRWDALEAADWQPVEGVSLNGVAAVQSAE